MDDYFESPESDDNDDDEQQGLMDGDDSYYEEQQIDTILKQRRRSLQILNQHFKDIEDYYEHHDNHDNEELEFYTYDTAPRENRIQIFWNIYQQWSQCLPGGGVERMLCIMMATFLVLMIVSIQLCLRMDWYLDWIWSTSCLRFPWRYLWWWNNDPNCLCEPPNHGEKISFDCYVLFLILGWLSSMFLAIFTMAIHFVYWCWWRRCFGRRRHSSSSSQSH
ncbi:hypothetical protein DERF_005776 [Dermatophagoides farinae]|uniref:Uncharacterized protein n=1 Tax=Dermatophagoides farinae TaxID=6954 RepID=A0A922L913_DERFA|nr:uncharacterized protein LOC124489763 [Dermatophagoides farinae]KAH7639265.1 hypothetical protein HUG17_3298 [Dermatophagoides farinae]KAH9522177.1 hypothetical protein DERF_005776 [Dermatophagoides farinae]